MSSWGFPPPEHVDQPGAHGLVRRDVVVVHEIVHDVFPDLPGLAVEGRVPAPPARERRAVPAWVLG